MKDIAIGKSKEQGGLDVWSLKESMVSLRQKCKIFTSKITLKVF